MTDWPKRIRDDRVIWESLVSVGRVSDAVADELEGPGVVTVLERDVLDISLVAFVLSRSWISVVVLFLWCRSVGVLAMPAEVLSISPVDVVGSSFVVHAVVVGSTTSTCVYVPRKPTPDVELSVINVINSASAEDRTDGGT